MLTLGLLIAVTILVVGCGFAAFDMWIHQPTDDIYIGHFATYLLLGLIGSPVLISLLVIHWIGAKR